MRKLFGRIPPVGNPITLKISDEIPEFPGSLKTYFVNSGTAALAAGLQIAQQHCNAKDPEVIIPAYCCPDLLSAILYNNMKPVLVDFIPDKPYMDLQEIEDALTGNTVAVIAVNFLGIPERFEEIKKLLDDRPTLLIEDSAQWFPENDDAFEQHVGDMVVYSFGRGKPVCVLKGGALLLRSENLIELKPSIKNINSATRFSLGPIPRSLLYNFAISSAMYWIFELLPFLKIGQTEYRDLVTVENMNAHDLRLLYENIQTYQQQSPSALNYPKGSKAIHLSSTCDTYNGQRTLRTPLLLSDRNEQRALLEVNSREGLGLSGLYMKLLPFIGNIPIGFEQHRNFPRAEKFAKQLITLPQHNGVRKDNSTRIKMLLRNHHPSD